MELFEEIYREAMLLRLQEARALNTIEEIYRALKKRCFWKKIHREFA